ncbi:MAG: flavodoxin family protein [Negativicutes bacterium]|jgi:multimeric flavodoxin WrbA
MKAIAINGSARKDGNTSLLIEEVFKVLRADGIETEQIALAGQRVRGCVNCLQCRVNLDKRCVLKDDIVNDCIVKMTEADIIILASPTYFTDITPELKAVIDRAGRVAKANGDMFKYKIGAGIIAVRRAGAIHAFDTLNHFFLIEQMIVPGANYWNIGIGMEAGDVLKDNEGLKTMQVLAANISWLSKKIRS